MDIMSYLMGQNSAIKKGMKVEVVTELPTTGETNVIYLVPKQTSGENDVFDEYLYVNDEWELIGSTAIDLSGYQPLLTAGDNITIDNNNVISGRTQVFVETTGNSNQNPFVFEGKEKGLYFVSFNAASNNTYFYYKTTNNDISYSSINVGITQIYIDKDYTTVEPLEEIFAYGYGIDKDGNVSRVPFKVDSQSKVYTAPYNSFNELVTENTVGQITAKKTFTVLPESSVVPTTNDQLVNKKYVDDSITAAITTTLGGSF